MEQSRNDPADDVRFESRTETLGRMSPEAYLAFEAMQTLRHEYVDGWLYAMVGASRRHEDIATNLTIAWGTHLKGNPCRVYKGDLKLRVGNDFYYPDVMVRCGDEPGDQLFEAAPVFIAEVLSPSTRRYDRSDKLAIYRKLESLEAYALIERDVMRVSVYRQGADEPELLTLPNEELRLPSLGFAMTLADLYD